MEIMILQEFKKSKAKGRGFRISNVIISEDSEIKALRATIFLKATRDKEDSKIIGIKVYALNVPTLKHIILDYCLLYPPLYEISVPIPDDLNCIDYSALKK